MHGSIDVSFSQDGYAYSLHYKITNQDLVNPLTRYVIHTLKLGESIATTPHRIQFTSAEQMTEFENALSTKHFLIAQGILQQTIMPDAVMTGFMKRAVDVVLSVKKPANEMVFFPGHDGIMVKIEKPKNEHYPKA